MKFHHTKWIQAKENDMTNLVVLGANGRMGRALIETIHLDSQVSLGAAIVRSNSSWIGVDAGEMVGIGRKEVALTDDFESIANGIDVAIDFTLPIAMMSNLSRCVTLGKAMVIGTTGLNDMEKQQLQQAAKHIPIVFAANFSVGVNLLIKLAQQTAQVMGHSADIEITETHHRFKKDAPSGTAMALGEAIADTLGRDLSQCAVYGREGDTGERNHETIGFATIRAGDVVGDHTVLFADLGERLELTHKASSRLTFAKGAVHAAKWVMGRPPGLYSMQDVLGFN